MQGLDGDESLRARGRGRPRTAESAGPSLLEVLNLVRTERATTRQELERQGEMGRAVVADRLALLTDLGLVDESELGTATGGRAPRLVRFLGNAGRILVASLDQTALGVGIADLSGRLLMEHHEPADLTEPAAALLDRLGELFDWILSRQPGPAAPPWAISLSVPSPVGGEAGGSFLTETPPILPGWEGTPVVESLVRRFGAPVWMRSSVETMTMGELHAGAGAGCRSMLFVKVGKRIGAGLVCDGRLWRGASGAAGLIGQLPVQSGDRTGSLEALAGSEMIAHEARTAAEDGRSPLLADLLRRHGDLSAAEVAQAAQLGDRTAMEILAQSGRLIGHVVATLANALNPEVIVLSGSVAQSNDILLAAVREAVYGASHPLVTRDLRILRSPMSRSAGLVGAAIVAVEGLFAPALLKDWVLHGRPMAHPGFVALGQRLGAGHPAGARAAPRNARG